MNSSRVPPVDRFAATTGTMAAKLELESPGFNCTHAKGWCRTCEIKTETTGIAQRKLKPLLRQLRQLTAFGHTGTINDRGRAIDLIDQYKKISA